MTKMRRWLSHENSSLGVSRNCKREERTRKVMPRNVLGKTPRLCLAAIQIKIACVTSCIGGRMRALYVMQVRVRFRPTDLSTISPQVIHKSSLKQYKLKACRTQNNSIKETL